MKKEIALSLGLLFGGHNVAKAEQFKKPAAAEVGAKESQAVTARVNKIIEELSLLFKKDAASQAAVKAKLKEAVAKILKNSSLKNDKQKMLAIDEYGEAVRARMSAAPDAKPAANAPEVKSELKKLEKSYDDGVKLKVTYLFKDGRVIFDGDTPGFSVINYLADKSWEGIKVPAGGDKQLAEVSAEAEGKSVYILYRIAESLPKDSPERKIVDGNLQTRIAGFEDEFGLKLALP